MATTIQIKRSPNVTAPTTTDLIEGELAYSYDQSNNGAGAKLYIEVLDSGGAEYIHTIGGKYYTAKIDAATSSSTASTLVSRDSLGNFSANTITANSFVGNIAASSAQKLTTARYINLGGDLQGNVLFDGSQDVTIVANVISNSVTLGTDTTGDYVANLTAGSGITLTNVGGESANVTVALSTSGVAATTYGSTTNIPIISVDQYGRITSASNAAISTSFTLAANSGTPDTFNSGDTLRIAGTAPISTAVTDNTITVSLATSGVTASTYGGAAVQPVITVDAYGRITSASNVTSTVANTNITGNIIASQITSIASSQITGDIALGTQTSGAYVANIIAGSGINITGLGNEGATPTIVNTGVTSLSGTANQITVSASNASVQLSLPNDVVINRDLSVSGNLYVTGNVVSLPVETVVVNDPLIQLANTNVSTDIVDIGFYGSYGPGSSASHYHTGLFRDASDGKYRLFQGLTEAPGTTVNISGNNYSIASLVANLTGGAVSSLTSNIAVSDGGTGRGTFTTNGILYGNATGALKVTAAGTYGKVLQAGSDGTPVYGGIDGGTY